MKSVVLFLIVFSATAFAGEQASLKLRQAVAHDIQGLVDDTVNEGEQTAEILQDEDGPAVECEISDNLKQPGFKWAFCRVAFEIHSGEDSTTRECGLLYTFNPGWISKSLDRGDEESFDSCLENLSESIE